MKRKITFLIAALAVIMLITQPLKVLAEDVTLTENFSSSKAASNQYNCSSQATTSGMQDDWDYSWTPSTVYVFKSGIRLGTSSATGSVTNTTMLSGISTGTSITIKVYAARWNTDTGNLTVTYNNSSESKAPSNSAITSTSNTYSSSDFSSSTNFTITKAENIASFSIASSSKRIIIDKVEVVYSSGGSTTPSINANNVNIAFNATSGAIEYTIDNGSGSVTASVTSGGDWLTKGDITASAVGFTCSPNTNTASNRTATVTLSFTDADDKVVTITQGKAPITIAAARTQGSGAVFTRGIVTYISGKYAYIQDESEAALCLYKSSADWNASTTELTVGDDVTAAGSLSTWNSLLEINGPTLTTISSGNAKPCVTKTVAQINTDNFSAFQGLFVQIEEATYNGSSANTITQNGQTVSVSGTMGEATTYDVVTFKGNVTSGITIRNLQDVSIIKNPTISAAASLTVPSYVQETPVANITAGSLSVTGSNLTAGITCTLDENSKFELYNGSTWTNTTTIAQTNGSASGSLQIRLKASQSYNASAYTGSVTLSSTGAANVVVSLSGSVTYATFTYDVNGATGSAPAALSTCTYGQEITLSDKGNLAKEGYNFGGWNTQANGEGTNYDAGDTYTIYANTTLYAKWNPASFNISKSDMTGGSVTVKIDEDEVTSATTGATVTLVVAPAANHALSTLTVTKSPSGSVTLSPSVSSSVLTYTFTMPASNVTVAATFVERYSLNIDFENSANTYTDWTFSTMDSKQTSTITANSGTYYGTTNGGNPAYIQTVRKIADPQSLTCYVSRQTDNNTASTWKVQVSSDGTTWTNVGDSQSAISMDKGSWVEITRDLSSYNYVYVRVYYSGSTATRNIDDLSLVYTPEPYEISVTSNANGTITATDGSTTISGGENANFEYDKTITLTAEGDETHMFSTWNVTETESGNPISVTDNKFHVPACAVTVAATFVSSQTFTFHVNGNTFTQKYATDSDVALPTQSEFTPEGYGIKGWTATESDVTSPLVTNTTADDNKIFYAVFGKTTYSNFNLVESAPANWSGYYLIVYNNEKAFDTHYSNNLNTNTYATIADISTYYSNKVITYNATTAQYIVKIEKTTNGYSIYDKDGYLGNSSNSNGSYLLWNDEFSAEQNEWTLGVNSIVGVKNSSKAIRYNTGSPRFAIYGTGEQAAIQLYKTTVSYEGAYTHIYPSNATPTDDIDVSESGPIVIENGGTLNMGEHSLVCDDPTLLIIEDGGQLILDDDNKDVQATVKKSVKTWTGSVASKDDPVNKGWQTISTSTRDDEDGSTIAFSNVDNLVYLDNTTPRYNVYAYDEANILWVNNLASAPYGFSTLNVGQGYIYRTGGSSDLEYKGYVNTGDVEVDLSYNCGTSSFKGFNLIGNPYTHSIYKGGEGSAIDNGSLLEAKYYALNLTTGMFTLTNDGTEIPRGTAIMVQAKAEGTLTMVNSLVYVAPTAKAGNDNIWFSVKNENFQDFACVDFKPGRGLNKIDHYNEDAPMLYINHNGENFGSVNMSDDTKSINLNFKAMTMGKYTLSLKPEGNFSYIHIIDKLTGEDVDMLLEGEYSFIASPSDADNRFIVRLGYQPDYGNENDIFAYQSGSEIYVTGNGELQIFDVTGRRVMTTTINGAESISIPNQGVYIFKLNEKVQKIVVR